MEKIVVFRQLTFGDREPEENELDLEINNWLVRNPGFEFINKRTAIEKGTIPGKKIKFCLVVTVVFFSQSQK